VDGDVGNAHPPTLPRSRDGAPADSRRTLAKRTARWFAARDLKKTLITLLLIFTAALPRTSADEWISDEYHCALTIPTQESWTAAIRQPLPVGTVIFHAISMVSSHGIMITYVSDLPSSDIRKPEVRKRIMELLETQGWTAQAPTEIKWIINRKELPFIQYILNRRDAVSGKLAGVARVTPHGKSLYVITAYGKGEADRSEDAEFMRVMGTFRFIEQPTVIVDHPQGPSAKSYRLAMLATGSAAALLFCAFAMVMLSTRRGDEQRA
jgi:hypothetical protein